MPVSGSGVMKVDGASDTSPDGASRASTWAKIAFGAGTAHAARTFNTRPTIIPFFFIKSQLGPVNTVTLYM